LIEHINHSFYLVKKYDIFNLCLLNNSKVKSDSIITVFLEI